MTVKTIPVQRRAKMRRIAVIITAITALLLVLSACGGNEKTNNTNAGKDNKPTQENAGTTEEPRVIQHAMGTTEVKGTPERVVVLTNEGTEALLALGVTPVGAVQSWTGDPWYDHIKEQMKDAKNLGEESQVNLEAIAALKPDLIIGNKMRQEAVYAQLSAIAPTVFAETLRGKWQDNFKLYAEAVNKADKGEEVMGAYDQRIAELKTKFADQLATKVSIVRFMPGKIRLYQKDTFSGIILDQIGFARPESQNKPAFAEEITQERIPEMDGDIVFYFTYEQGDGEATKLEQEVLNNPLFKNLNAAKNNQVFKVSDTIWNTAGGVLAANLMLDDLDTFFSAK